MDSIIPSSLKGSSKNVLLLGAGFVTRPTAVELDKAGVNVTVACRTLESAKKLCEGLKHANAISLNVSDKDALEKEISKVQLVISLIPYTFHAQVIRAAINQKRHVVTTSYVSDAMMALNQEAKDAGITVFNEIGLDPGIDHLYAVKTIDEVHNEGGKVISFWSYCGGLPAPENSDNPLGYKFSWSPRGVLLAARNTAQFYKDGKKETTPGEKLMSSARPYHIYPGYAFEAYPNRDSTPFRERYNIPEAQNLVRGTLRYQGNPAFIQTLRDLGMLSEEEQDFLKPTAQPVPSWKEAFAKIVGATGNSEQDLVWAVSSKTKFANNDEKDRIVAGLRWFGLFSDAQIEPRGNPLDCLCAAMEGKMQYEKGERDFVMLQHKFEIEWANGKREMRTSTLCDYGEPEGSGGYSAMARLVGVPCAVAVLMVLDGEIKDKGVLAPVTGDISEPIRKKLQKDYGIEMKEKTLA
ncbi:Saccharopine dehydrogenase [Hortaea werneckii]|uniref:Saccharopine dehydrogenase [NADP(+), L-glutamate-forming] n=2 Tax=Hortaea werneckii TaxID=91943 RepID=A0A3M7I6D4_HORWE|nr:Saccharopine dehydrogenase [Hortaea werneckii]OTA34502.1 Saccharopine dehydrogenase [NADP(+), L-glutamate-forming] [Hortaea werneckii EXF-2000]KAI6817717.1 Saccharopine dehydrogenase [Hortaea werneckii]KAI6922848.1 Saccharopine dehydrogenase [Hortaea werneckii]KAI6965035.1 Saccharopine dehydrogenase [Hortaea werneckii]